MTAAAGFAQRGTGTAIYAVLPSRSGVRVYGEQRGAALAITTETAGLILSSHRTRATRLFRNIALDPGCELSCEGR